MNPLIAALLQQQQAQAQAQQQPSDDPTAIPMMAPAANPYAPNPALEQKVAPTAYPVNPLVLALAQKFGMMNLIRNSQKEKESALMDIQ